MYFDDEDYQCNIDTEPAEWDWNTMAYDTDEELEPVTCVERFKAIKRVWRAAKYLLKLRYQPEESDLECLADCLAGRNLDWWGIPAWMAPTWLTAHQRAMLIDMACWAGQGSNRRKELELMSDRQLATTYTYAIWDYSR